MRRWSHDDHLPRSIPLKSVNGLYAWCESIKVSIPRCGQPVNPMSRRLAAHPRPCTAGCARTRSIPAYTPGVKLQNDSKFTALRFIARPHPSEVNAIALTGLIQDIENSLQGCIILPLQGPIAQLGERCVRNAEVGSSILLRSTNSKTQPLPVGFFLARRASTGGAFGGVWCFADTVTVRYPAR